MKKKITKRVVDAVDPHPIDDVFVWDTELKGFGVRVKPSGTRAFLLSYYAPGLHRVRRRLTIGAYGLMTVDQAREEAKRHLGTIADGADPAAAEADDRRRSREETITALFPYYLSEMTGRWKPRTRALITDLGNRFIIPALGSVPVRALTPQRVIELHRTLGEERGHVTANHVGRALRAFWNWADRRGMVEGKNPMSRIGWYRETSRERFLSGAELARLGEALRVTEETGLPPAPGFRAPSDAPRRARNSGMFTSDVLPAYPPAIACLRFLLFSGWRKSEALGLRWDQVDVERRLVVLPDSKTGKSVRVLNAPALKLLTAQPKVASSPFVFPSSRDPMEPIADITRLWYAVRHYAKLDDVRLHDLRHSLASVAAGHGASLLVIQHLLGHKDNRSTLRYRHLADTIVSAAAETVGDTIAAALGRAPTVPSVLLTGRR